MLHWTAQLQDFPTKQKILAYFALLIGFSKALPVIRLQSGGINKFPICPVKSPEVEKAS